MSEKTFDAIMQEITSNLSGDPAEDVPYLMQQAEAHKDNAFGKEIARACGRLIFSALPDDKKAQLNRTVGNHVLGIESVIEEAQFKMYR